MTVPSTRFREDYAGNGSATSFPYAFRIFKATDLVVTKTDNSGNETTLTLGTDYTVTGAGSYNGGAVVLTTALPTSYRLTIERVLAIRQDTDLRNQGEFLAETHEDAFDRLTMIVQRLAGYLGMGQDGTLRTLLLGTGDVDGAGAFRARGNRISGLGNPVSGQDAVTKAWFDQAVTTSVNQAANSAASAAASAAAAEDSEQASLVIATQFGDMATAITQTEAARDTALSAKTAAQSSATSAASSATSASTAKSQAEAARDAAQLSAGVYADTAAGIAAVADGRYFSVPDAGGVDALILYRRSGATAVEVTRYPSSAYLDFVQKPFGLLMPAISDASGVELLGFDATGAAVFKLSNYVLQQLLTNLSTTYASISAIDGLVQEPTSKLPGIFDAAGVELLGFDETGAARLRVSKSVADQVSALIGFAPYDPIASGLLPRPTITCWGDSMTQGAGGDGTNITSVMGTVLSRTVNNRGIGGQGAVGIAIRQGGYPLTVTLSGNQIPASGGVAVTAKNNNILSAGGSFTGTAHVTIAGVPGVISTDASGNWTFTRDAAGAVVSVAAGVQAVIDDVGTTFIPAPGQNRADTVVIWSGRNGVIGLGRTAVLECRDRIADMIKHLTPLSKRVIVVSVCNGRRLDSATGNNYEPSGSSRYNDVLALNRELKETFGNSFVDLRYYMVNHAIYDAGLTPTATDLADIAADCIPTSLLVDNVHFNPTGYTLAGQFLARQLIARGW